MFIVNLKRDDFDVVMRALAQRKNDDRMLPRHKKAAQKVFDKLKPIWHAPLSWVVNEKAGFGKDGHWKSHDLTYDVCAITVEGK